MRAARSDLPLSFGDVSLTVGATTILDRLNLTIGPGAPTLILGPNGSGKTSLLRLCMGLASPSRGAVSWGGRTDGGPERPRRGVGCRRVRNRTVSRKILDEIGSK